MKPYWNFEPLKWPSDVAAAIYHWARGGEIAWLDSGTGTEDARFSIIARRPLAVIEQFDGQDATLTTADAWLKTDSRGFRLFRDSVRSVGAHFRKETAQRPPEWRDLPLPGWIGYLGYEVARQLERLPARRHVEFGLPVLRMALFDATIVLDHRTRTAWAVSASGLSATLAESIGVVTPWNIDPREICDDWETAVRAAFRPERAANVRVRHDVSRAEHTNIVRRAIEYIAAGDIYQVNLAQRIRVTGVGNPFSTYAALRTRNPAPYGALFRWRGGAIASVSPELFLRLQDRDVLTSPIKGTRPRMADAMLDAAFREQLLASEKDAAELAMIVDLHRNDLGRVCAPGSIRVGAARRLEAHPTVFHTVADVTGRLTDDRDAIDLLAACFPAGSISGVPKIRAMEIIDELEPVARGAYTGAIGYLGLDGSMTMNVAIRTLQQRGSEAVLHVGGGIVADSDPDEEYDETLAKARGILEALRAAAPARIAT